MSVKIKHYSDGWYLVGFLDKDLRIGPFETFERAKKDLRYLRGTDEATTHKGAKPCRALKSIAETEK